MKIALPAAAALALGACAQNADNETASEEVKIDDPAATDPATANLTINSSPTVVDQAINQTDQQSGIGNAADEAAESISNSIQ